MSFFDKIKNGISVAKKLIKDGGETNELLQGVIEELEQLHAQGKLSNVVYNAEKAFEKEHTAYIAKHQTTAGDSMGDILAIKNFLHALKDADLPAITKEKVDKLVAYEEEINNVVGRFGIHI